ncbi:MAG: glycine cleavage system protein GcvH [Actinomycetia bacterium]|nr:glycine cleavage system protein GcvH [Actinomycetes bacterium]MCP4227138.1 glycine cleavage system protein GcvH [Actinomycetes bacterium]MCP5033036.1 glycine cleavage system protein GcvH [Actinomycetes bacterium]
MSQVRNCNIPDDLYYLVEKHVWLSYDGDLVTIGMTDVAQHLAKTFLSVTAKAPGKQIKKGRSVATVESSKWVGPVPSPIAGEVVEVNQAVVDHPPIMNGDPYGEGWVARLRANDWDTDSAELVTGAEGVAAYEQFLEAEGIDCGEE